LLCFIDINSSYGFAVVFAAFDGQRVKVFETPKFKPPNQGRRLKEAAKRKSAASHGAKTNVNFALARLSERFDSKGWVKQIAAICFRKALEYAREGPVWVNIDISDDRTVRGGRLQRTLLSIKRVAANLAAWYGVHITFRCYPSRRCPLCGGELKEFKTKRTRIMRCEKCGFYEDRDFTPFYNFLKSLSLPLPKHPLAPLPNPEALRGRAGGKSRLAEWWMSG